MSAQVNLDALIKREDLYKENNDESFASVDTSETKSLKIEGNLRPDSYFFKTLKKADFQRVTSEWKPERVAGLIKSFINGDIIPAIILWNWKGHNFIIDGGHRLSALVAWITNDYGDREISEAYFGPENITKEQRKNADKTRKLIDNDPEIGSFGKYTLAFEKQKGNEEFVKASNILVHRSIAVQWIKANSSQEAEMAFFRINGEATPIDDTEAIILKSRKKPNGIAARAIIHAGSAHKYWKAFDTETQITIEKIAIEINELLFEPPLEPKAMRLPCGGNEYATQTLELVFGIVNIINDLEDINLKKSKYLKMDADAIMPIADENGESTIQYLNKTKRIVSIISGTGKDAISLGLSTVIYFYNHRGRFQITSFFTMIYIAVLWDKERKENGSDIFQRFCSVREKFEDFLLNYKSFITQATTNIGSGVKSYKRLAELFLYIIDELLNGKGQEEIISAIQLKREFAFVKVIKSENEYAEQRNLPGKKPNKETNVQVAIKAYLNARIKCPFCGGHATFESYNSDHITEARNGGLANIENLAFGHIYCNVEKDKIIQLKEKLISSLPPNLES